MYPFYDYHRSLYCFRATVDIAIVPCALKQSKFGHMMASTHDLLFNVVSR